MTCPGNLHVRGGQRNESDNEQATRSDQELDQCDADRLDDKDKSNKEQR